MQTQNLEVLKSSSKPLNSSFVNSFCNIQQIDILMNRCTICCIFIMDCPYCKHTESRVTNKRTCPEGIRRRRECLKCKKRFTTYEKICQEDLFVIKKDGTRQRFEREKLAKGLNKAIEKRPVSQKEIDNMIDEIESSLGKKEKRK